MMRRLTDEGKKGNKGMVHYMWSMAVPLAFVSGLYFGGYTLRKMRQHWEGGPMD